MLGNSIGTFTGANKDTDESKILRDFLSGDYKKGEAIFGTIFSSLGELIEDLVSEHIKKLLTPEHTVSNIELAIGKVVNEVGEILQPKLKKKYLEGEVLPSVSYRIYIYWIIKKLQKAGFDLSNSIYSDVPREHGEDIYNILGDRALTTFFMVGKGLGMLDFSKNDINQFEEEKELKVLDTSYNEVNSGLRRWKKSNSNLIVKEHRSATIEDDYYDDINLRFDRFEEETGKKSFRIRRKIYDDGGEEYFYTIKRKLDIEEQVDTRTCLEKEFAIGKYWNFTNFLDEVGLKNSRSKKKTRKSFSISYYDEELKKQIDAKLDIDDYGMNEIPEFLEIECNDDMAIPNIMKNLGLEGKTTLAKGSRGLFRHYGVYDDYDRNYSVDEKTGKVNWNDGNVGNINEAPRDIFIAA